MTMREKIAALFELHHGEACYPDAMDFEALAFADAVLDALREPTPYMLEEGNRAHRHARRSGVSGMTIDAQVRAECAREAACWHAMIDAAKGEK